MSFINESRQIVMSDGDTAIRVGQAVDIPSMFHFSVADQDVEIELDMRPADALRLAEVIREHAERAEQAERELRDGTE